MGDVTCTVDLRNRCGIKSKLGSFALREGRTRTAAISLVRRAVSLHQAAHGRIDIPTLTGVLPSSSDTLLLSPGLLVKLSRLKLLVGLVSPGRWADGEVGGELAILSLQDNDRRIRECAG